MKTLLFAIAAVLLWAARASAHETPTAEVELELLTATEARVSSRGLVTLASPLGCRFDDPVLRCPDGLAGKVLELKGAGITFVRIVRDGETTESLVATPAEPSIVVPGGSGARHVALRFARLGVEHVLTGLDHILFLLALFFQARGSLRLLAKSATAFTIGHSVTLGATMLGALHLRSDVAEVCIAWSLVLVALDVGGAVAAPRALLAGAFGLVHGLGFAGAIAETRIPDAARWTALLSFNLGIEVGQIALFAGCLALIALIRRLPPPAAVGYAVGVTGAAMLFLRLASLFR